MPLKVRLPGPPSVKLLDERSTRIAPCCPSSRIPSAPSPPTIVSAPQRPSTPLSRKTSSPAPPSIRLFPRQPLIASLPAPPKIWSSPVSEARAKGWRKSSCLRISSPAPHSVASVASKELHTGIVRCQTIIKRPTEGCFDVYEMDASRASGAAPDHGACAEVHNHPRTFSPPPPHIEKTPLPP